MHSFVENFKNSYPPSFWWLHPLACLNVWNLHVPFVTIRGPGNNHIRFCIPRPKCCSAPHIAMTQRAAGMGSKVLCFGSSRHKEEQVWAPGMSALCFWLGLHKFWCRMRNNGQRTNFRGQKQRRKAATDSQKFFVGTNKIEILECPCLLDQRGWEKLWCNPITFSCFLSSTRNFWSGV